MMYALTVPGPEKQPKLCDFLDEPDTLLDIWVASPGSFNNYQVLKE